MSINLRGVFLCYTAAARQMIAQGHGGKIIGAASIAAHKGFGDARATTRRRSSRCAG